MPLHDWTRVEPGLFHDFHSTWLVELKRELQRTLPPSYYALVEQIAGGFGPDVLTLEEPDSGDGEGNGLAGGGVAVIDAPPKVQFEVKAEIDAYAAKAKHLTVRHFSHDRIVAVLEVVSPGNKSNGYGVTSFIRKAIDFIHSGVHLLIVDPHPPGPRDPEGLHRLIWDKIDSSSSFQMPKDKNRLLAAYRVGSDIHAYLNTVGVGDGLPAMPLFLTTGRYLPVDLEATYLRAFELVPSKYQRILESPQ
jgi:hypothetical protein